MVSYVFDFIGFMVSWFQRFLRFHVYIAGFHVVIGFMVSWFHGFMTVS